jgi:hypothetical protein
VPTSENLRFGGGLSGTALHPIVMILLIIAILLILVLPRKYVIVPFLMAIFLTPFGQQLYVGGVHFFIPRILILFGWARIGLTPKSSESGITSGGFSPIDKVFICWAAFRATATYLEFLEAGALINQCAFLWDTVGGFFLLRYLIREEEDILRVVRTLGFIVCLLAVTMAYEKLHGVNPFGYMGGRLAPMVRDDPRGHLRDQFQPVPLPQLSCLFSCGCGRPAKQGYSQVQASLEQRRWWSLRRLAPHSWPIWQ